MANFCVTYTITTYESAEQGEYYEQGFILERGEGETLRDYVDALQDTRTSKVNGLEGIDYCFNGDSGVITYVNGMEYETGATECRTLHIDGITESSFKRLVSLLC